MRLLVVHAWMKGNLGDALQLTVLLTALRELRPRVLHLAGFPASPSPALDGVLATMYDARTLHSREVLERVVDAFGDDVLETVIGRTVKFPDASVSGMPITEFAPEHAAAQAYLRLARELVARGAVA